MAVARMIGGSSFIFLCRVAGAGLTFASQVLMARWMGAAELGAYVVAFSWCILLSNVASAGLPMAAMRFVSGGLASGDTGLVHGFVRRGNQFILLLGAIVAVAGVAVVLGAGDLLNPAYRMPLLMAMAIVPFFALLSYQGGVANAHSWLIQGFLPSNVLRPLLFLILIWGLAAFAEGLTSVGAMQAQGVAVLTVSALAAWALAARLRTTLPDVPRRYETRLWIRTALPLLGVTLFTGYLAEITVVLAGFYLPADEVAIFQVSYRVALLIAFGLYAVDAFTAPEAARLIASPDGDNLQRIVNRATRLRFWPSVVAVIGLAVAGRWILGIFGAEFVSGYPVLVILAAAQLAPAAVGPVTRLMSVSGHQDRCLYVSLGSLVLLLPLVALLAPAYGVVGAAWAVLLDMVVWSAWMRWMIVRYLNIRPAVV